MVVNWSSNVNSKFYGMETSSVENIEELQFESGLTRSFLKNSSSKKSHSLKFTLETQAEEEAFWNWYDNELLSRTQNFYLTDLIKHSGVKEYRMTSEPAIPDSQYPKECSFTVVEV